MRRKLALGVAATTFGMVLAAPRGVAAHSRWEQPPARSLDDGLTDGPCGGISPTDARMELPAGGSVELRWSVTQSHANEFRVAFSADGEQGFDDAILGTVPDLGRLGELTQLVELPACVCETCTLQLLQLTASGNGGYYSCADIRLTGAELPQCDQSTGSSSSDDGAESSTSAADESTTSESSGAVESEGGSSDGGGASSDATSDSTPAALDPDDAAEHGCACTHGPTRPSPAWALALLAIVRRRRSRTHGDVADPRTR